MDKVVFLTIAYNAQETLERAVNSVLQQTYENFIYYVVDNGSTDKTRKVLKKLAPQDTRIKPVYYDANSVYRTFELLPQIVEREKNDCKYLAILDSDDAYLPHFLGELIPFAHQNSLDFVCGGSQFVAAASGQSLGCRGSNSDVVFTSRNCEDVAQYYGIIRPVWCKLFSLERLQSLDYQPFLKIRYGADTAFCLSVIEHCENWGIKGGVHHKYYMNAQSDSYRFDSGRTTSDADMLEIGYQFCLDKFGRLNPRNEEFLLCVYMNALKDTLRILLAAENTQSEKISDLRKIFLTPQCAQLAGYEMFGALFRAKQDWSEQRRELFSSVVIWLLSVTEVPDCEVEGYCELGEFVSAAAEDRNAWLAFKKLRIQFWVEQKRIDKAADLLDEISELLPEDEEILDMAKKCKKMRFESKKAALPTEEHLQSEINIRGNTGCDSAFYGMIDHLKTNTLDQLLSNAVNWANKWVEEDHEYYGLLLKWYRSWYRVGLFGQDQGFINYFGGMYQYLKENAEGLIWLYEELADYRSKMSLKTILEHWMTFHPDLRNNGRECLFEHYFDLDVIKCDRNEVFVDCGCFDGETVKSFIRSYGGQYKNIYSYELTPSTYEVAKANLKGIPRVYLRNAGVSDKNGQFPFWDSGNNAEFASNRLNASGNAIATVVKIDDDIQEPITFLKMDIEGAECEALRGAEQQIRLNRPKLAISLYHKLTDLLDIPRLIRSYIPDYKLYLRHDIEGKNEFPFPTEYVLLAI